ncbi:MAG TPA: tetratricopeptide repeat protein, partial [Gemmataceae bacterium]|nr:tetratricopeptide repeat protein [Gemmataceae bacterium]
RPGGRANFADGKLKPAIFNLPSAVLAALLVSAAPLPDVDRLVRQGNDAFEKGEIKESLRFFEEAEVFAPDPALVAFNKAAALYRLERYGEAALHYQRCLEDDAIPARRRSLAFFQMGNAYLRESQGAARPYLERALDAYRACLLMEETPAEVRSDTRHNLELTRLLWLKTLPDPDDPPRSDERKPKDPKNPERDDMKDGKSPFKTDEQGSRDATDSGKGQSPAKSKKALSGPLTVLPDESELVPLSPQETEAHLENIAQRILQERRHYHRHTVLVPEHVKDW